MLNHIVIMGRLGRDPELRRTTTGTPVASFTMAVDRDFKDKTTGERPTDWINVVAWRSTAEFVTRYFTKGRMAVVEGRLQVRNWTDKNGNPRTTAEVVADNIYFADSQRREPEGGAAGASGTGYSGYQTPPAYSAPASGSYSTPAAGGYSAAPTPSYPTPTYSPNPGYSAAPGYSAPAEGDQFSELADDDGDLPF